jgi:hypothetical protein
MKVLIMVAVDPDRESDLQIVMVAQPGGVARASSIVTLKGAEPGRTGNPYLVYGDAVEAWLGCDKFDTSISIFDCRSGDLGGWV